MHKISRPNSVVFATLFFDSTLHWQHDRRQKPQKENHSVHSQGFPWRRLETHPDASVDWMHRDAKRDQTKMGRENKQIQRKKNLRPATSVPGAHESENLRPTNPGRDTSARRGARPLARTMNGPDPTMPSHQGRLCRPRRGKRIIYVACPRSSEWSGGCFTEFLIRIQVWGAIDNPGGLVSIFRRQDFAVVWWFGGFLVGVRNFGRGFSG